VKCFTLRTGELRELTPSENAVWGARLFIEMGLLDPVPVLPLDAPSVMRSRVNGGRWTMTDVTWNRQRILNGFRWLAGIHWLFFPGRPAAYTRHYAASWCSVSLDTTYQAICWLERQGELRRVPMEGKRANHFLPRNGRPPEGGSPE
jgi:hypothetical protein